MMMWWLLGFTQSPHLDGPTGSGKSTIIEQFGARMGVPVFRIGYHIASYLYDWVQCNWYKAQPTLQHPEDVKTLMVMTAK